MQLSGDAAPAVVLLIAQPHNLIAAAYATRPANRLARLGALLPYPIQSSPTRSDRRRRSCLAITAKIEITASRNMPHESR
jgi:hypothetical protein